jgi:hypothetical protein
LFGHRLGRTVGGTTLSKMLRRLGCDMTVPPGEAPGAIAGARRLAGGTDGLRPSVGGVFPVKQHGKSSG